MKKITLPLALLLITAASSSSLAMESMPLPMRQLYQESDLIVVATVGVVSSTLDAQGYRIFIARLSPEMVLKGTLQSFAVKVAYELSLCPAPPRYKVGERVLAFLQRSSEGQYYHTIGSHWGVKHLSPPVLEAYVARLQELQAIENSEPSVRESQLLDWLVRCAEDPATRWEGAYELSPPTNCAVTTRSPNFALQLSSDQKKRLVDALYHSRIITKGEVSLVSLLELWGDPQLAAFVFDYLNEVKERPPNGTIWPLMTVVAKAARSPEALELSKRFLELGCLPDHDEKLRTTLSAFISVIEQTGKIARFSPPPDPLPPTPNSGHAVSSGSVASTLRLPSKIPRAIAPFGIGVVAMFLGLFVASVSARLFLGR